MIVQVRACVQSVHHQHTHMISHMISDGHASIDDVPVRVKTSLHKVQTDQISTAVSVLKLRQMSFSARFRFTANQASAKLRLRL